MIRLFCLFFVLLLTCTVNLPSALAAKGKTAAPARGASEDAPAQKAAERTEKKRSALLTDVKHWSNPDYTRIAISLDHDAVFETHQLKSHSQDSHPSRVYLDIHHARTGAGKSIPVGDGLLKQIRVAQYTPDTVRVAIDLESIGDFKVFTFSDPFRIIIDFRGGKREELKSLQTVIEAAPTGRKALLPVVEAPDKSGSTDATLEPGIQQKPRLSEAKEKVRKRSLQPGAIRRIVVDAGHGGHDPGAVGKGGTQEKDVVLKIAQEVAERVQSELGIDVVMTRTTDHFIELQERTAIANKVGADLFISIHANAASNRNANGIETYYLNLAKTEKVAQLAALENGTSLEKVSILQAVLFDLMANYKLNDSALLADAVQKAVYKRVSEQFSPLKNLGVKQGPFYVLVGATMPSILVETAFISNATEEGRLNRQEYIEAAAEGITDGVRSYVKSLSREAEK